MGRVRITRLFVLLALAALLAPRAEASRTSAWGSNTHTSLSATTTPEAGLLASLAPAAPDDTDATEQPLFNLGDVVLVDTADADEERFDLGPLTLVDINLLRGPPPSYPETRVGGFELLPPFRVGASPTPSLWSRQACGFSCREVVSDSRYDPWGLTSFREWVNEFADDAFSGGSALKKGAAAGLFLLDAAFSVASAGATDKIHGAQEALDRGQISDAEYWKRTGVAVGQTVASYAGGAAAGAAGARAGVRLLGSTGVTAGGVRAVGALSGASAGVGSQLAADVVGNVAGTQDGLSSGRNYALSALIGGASGAASALPGRTARDLAIDGTAPRALSTRRPIGKDPYQNRLAQRDIAAAELEGATNVRVNQQQVTATGERVGVNRPDVQYTDATGRRIYVEYDIAPAERAVPHALRLLANDSAGKVYLMTTPPAR